MGTTEIKICSCCKTERQNRNRRPRVLEELRVKTQKRRLPVHACEHCDGATIDLAARENKPVDLNKDVSTRPEDQ